MESMYHTAQKVEANNMRLRHAIKLCRLACEVFEVLIELRMSESRNPSSSVYEYDYSNSPDREPVLLKHSAPYRARSLLHTLDANTELQQFLPLVTKIRQITSAEYPAYTSHWPNNSSQNTGTTSGLSSLSGGVETEITQSDIDRLKHYTQALRQYENHLVTTLITVDGLKSLDTVKKGEMLKDCQLTEQGSSRGDIVDLEDAAHAEELCKVREEKAELRVSAGEWHMCCIMYTYPETDTHTHTHHHTETHFYEYIRSHVIIFHTHTHTHTVSDLHDGAGETSYGVGSESNVDTQAEV